MTKPFALTGPSVVSWLLLTTVSLLITLSGRRDLLTTQPGDAIRSALLTGQ